MLNFHQSMPFLNWLFPLLHFPQEFPARISCKIFPQDFPELDPDWLAPHHPIPNAKFPPITGLLNRPTYHKRSKVSPPPFPQILWEPQINEYYVVYGTSTCWLVTFLTLLSDPLLRDNSKICKKFSPG